jgi:membrane-associated phospholipid phosphatase
VLVVAYASEPAANLDAVALDQFSEPLRRPLLARAAREISSAVDPEPFAVLAAALCAAALLRGVREAIAVAVLLAGANVTTQLLKPLLAEPRGTLGGWVLGPEAFPSGHATAAMSVALAALVVAPRALRPLAAAGGAVFAISVGFALVALDAHFPSDVAGGYLMAGGWCFAVLAALLVAERRWPRPGRHETQQGWESVALVGLLALVVLGAAVGASRLPDLIGYARGHTVFAVVAGATGVLAAVLVAAATVAAAALPTRASGAGR